MTNWRIFIRRHWRLLSRLGAAAVLALAALMFALPRASADAGQSEAIPELNRLLFSPERLSSNHFAQHLERPRPA